MKKLLLICLVILATNSLLAYVLFDGFETGNTNGSTTINQWTQVIETGSYRWTANSGQTSYNRTPRTGLFNVTLHYNANTWLFRPVDLVGGNTYNVELYARQDGSIAANANIGIYLGITGEIASMTQTVVAQTGLINGGYQRIYGQFTAATSGTYYLGIHGYINSTPWYISIDDVSIQNTLAPPELSIEPQVLNFGEVSLNLPSTWKNVNLTNVGGGELFLFLANIAIIGSDAAQFEFDGANLPANLESGGSVVIPVRFTPTSPGLKSAILQIMFGGVMHNAQLAGSGLPPGTVIIGEGNSNFGLPINPHYGYTYSQCIYLQAEIGLANMRIERLKYYYNGVLEGVSSNNWTIYLGHTQKSFFESTTDWVPLATMTQVFSGEVALPATAGWIEITLSNPYVYNNIDNLVIAVDENEAGYESSTAVFFYSTASPNYRGLRHISDSVNCNPASPVAGSRVLGFANVRLLLEEALPLPPEPANLLSPTNGAMGLSTWGFDFSWSPGLTGGTPTHYQFGLSTSLGSLWSGYVATTSESFWNPVSQDGFLLQYATTYFWAVRSFNAFGESISAVYSFVTEDAPLVISTFPWMENFEGINFPPDGWKISNRDGAGTTWQSSTSYNHTPGGVISAAHTYSYDPVAGQDGWLITPGLHIPLGTQPLLSFWNYNYYSSDYVNNGLKINTVNNPNDPNWVQLWSPTDVAAIWSNVRVNLDAYSGQTVFFAFNYTGYNADNWYVDDVSIFVNHPPQLALPASVSFLQNTSLTVDFSPYVSDPDVADSLLTLSVNGGTNVNCVVNGMQVTFSVLPNWSGSEIVTVSVTDGIITIPVAAPLAVEVLNSFNADFYADLLNTYAGIPIQFTDLTPGNPNYWEWDFNNDSVIDSYEQNPIYTYNTMGNKTVSLNVAYFLEGAYMELDNETKLAYIHLTATLVGGSVSGAWTLSGSPYMVGQEIHIESGNTLTIQPGVEVLFQVNVPFAVYGTIVANNVYFGVEPDLQSQTYQPWKGLMLNPDSQNSILNDIELYNAEIPVMVATSNVILNNLTISKSDSLSFLQEKGVLVSNASPALDSLDIENYAVGLRVINNSGNRSEITPSLTNVRIRSTSSSIRTDRIGIEISGFVEADIDEVDLLDFDTGISYIGTGEASRTNAPTLTNVRIRSTSSAIRTESTGIYVKDIPVFSVINSPSETDSIANYDHGIVVETDQATSSSPTISNVRIRSTNSSVRTVTTGISLMGNVAGTLQNNFMKGFSKGCNITGQNSSQIKSNTYLNCYNGISVVGAQAAPNIKHNVLYSTMSQPLVSAFNLQLCNGVNIRNNTVDGYAVAVNAASATCNFTQNIVWNASPLIQPINTTDSNVSVNYNNIFDASGVTAGVANINANPLFAATTAADYHLTALSPCIDAGNPALAPDADGSVADLGAFPYFHSASFTVNPPLTAAVGDTVNFSSSWVGHDPASAVWQWYFRSPLEVDSNLPNPAYSYTQPGTYDIVLKLTTGNFTDTVTLAGYEVTPAEPLSVPQNLTIERAGVSIVLHWEQVNRALSYYVYASPAPEGPYESILQVFDADLSDGIVACNLPINHHKRFYRITAAK